MAIYCRYHPDEKVRYYCRECAIPLCPECVSAHARHDFIPADNKAAIEIRYILRNEKSKIIETTKEYEDVLSETLQKLSDMEKDRM
jgi:hypothetical protein